jgi:hypothetical protein
MAIILDKYAIKEVADVMFYELDSKGAPSAPVLYLDTLKTSTLSQSSEVVDARGGKGNVKLLSWDTNKELTIEMEDAVFSAKSLQIMFGGKMYVNGDSQEVLKTVRGVDMTNEDADNLSFVINGNKYYIAKGLVTAFSYNDATATGSTISGVTYGKEVDVPVAVEYPDWENKYGAKTEGGSPKQKIEFVTFDLLDCTSTKGGSDGIVSGGMTIDIGAEFNSNTYYITGDTYARNVASGKDEFLQFIIPKGKVSAEDVSLTMEADGDPATFAMTVQCLKSEGKGNSMVKLVKYTLADGSGSSAAGNKGVASVLDDFNASTEHESPWASPKSVISQSSGGSKTETTVLP